MLLSRGLVVHDAIVHKSLCSVVMGRGNAEQMREQEVYIVCIHCAQGGGFVCKMLPHVMLCYVPQQPYIYFSGWWHASTREMK